MRKFTSWDERFNYEQTITALYAIDKEFISHHSKRYNGSHSGISTCDLQSLADMDIDYSETGLHDAILFRQRHAFLSKFEPLRNGVDKKFCAITSFVESESKCRQINEQFRAFGRGDFLFPARLIEQLFAAQSKIRSMLGPVPKLSDLHLRLGPGATTNVKKRWASVTRKFSETLACSEELVPYLSEVLYELPTLLPFEEEVGQVPVEIHHGQLVFVPKNARTYRSVVVEPMLNTMCQAGIGDHLRRVLLRSGIDIRDQSRNQRSAREGSLTGALATLDLSSASDTISLELVAFLLPLDWFMFLKRFRTPTVTCSDPRLPGTIRLQKFSSMGNGYTFPLETLIFYALTWAASHRRDTVTAYGDDIICHTSDVVSVISLLETCGFSVNSKKSYVEGPFRESCGADYYKGVNIRPFYVKDLLSCERVFSLHNFFYNQGYFEFCDWIKKTFLDPTLYLYGPPEYGDGHLHDHSFRGKIFRRKFGWEGFIFETFTHKARYEFSVLPGDRVLPSYSTYARESPEEAILERGAASSLLAVRQALRNEVLTGLPVQRGRPVCTLPGTARGCKRIRIYTLIG